MKMDWWKIFRQPTSQMGETRRRGVATLEMAVMIPLMVLLLLGAIDFGRIFYAGVTVASAARSGASYGSLSGDLSQDTTGIKLLAEEDSQDLGQVSVTVERFCECADGSLVDCSSACVDGLPRVYVKVTAEKTFQALIPFPGIPDPVTVRKVAYMRAR